MRRPLSAGIFHAALLVAWLAAPSVSALPIDMVRTGSLGHDHNGDLLGAPFSIAVDPADDVVYVVCSEPPEVVAMDTNGRLLLRIDTGREGSSPYGVWCRSDGRLLVTDTSTGSITVYDAAGSPVEEIDLRETVDPAVVPGRISGNDDEMLVVDLSAGAVLRLDARGGLLDRIDDLDRPQKAIFDDAGIVVSCARGAAVRRFDLAGHELDRAGSTTAPEQERVSYPGGLTRDSRHRLWLADAFRHRLLVFDENLRHLMTVGRMDDGRGKWGFLLPVDVAVDGRGRLLVVEKGADRIQVFDVVDLQGADHE